MRAHGLGPHMKLSSVDQTGLLTTNATDISKLFRVGFILRIFLVDLLNFKKMYILRKRVTLLHFSFICALVV